MCPSVESSRLQGTVAGDDKNFAEMEQQVDVMLCDQSGKALVVPDA